MNGRIQAWSLVCVLALSTLGEGGGSATSLFVWHGALLAVVGAWLAVDRWSVGWSSLSGTAVTAFALFGGLFLVGAWRAPYGYAAWLVLLELVASVLVFALASAAGPTALRTMIGPLLWLGAAHAAWLVGSFCQGGGRPAGTFLNPNHAALWLCTIALVGFGSGRRRDLALAAVALAGALATGSRGALIAFLVGASCLALMSWRRLGRTTRIAALAALTLVVLAVGVRLAARDRGWDPFRYHRVRIWQASLGPIAERPLWGTGPGQFSAFATRLSFDDGEGPLRFDKRFSQTHSDAIRLPAETGVPAACAALAAAWLLARAFAAARRRRGDPLGEGAIAAIVAIAAQALVDNPSSWPSVYLLGAALAGSLLAVERDPGVPRSAWITRLATLALAVIVFTIGDAAPYFAWRQVSGLPRAALDERALRRLEGAAHLNPWHPDYHMRAALHESASARRSGLAGYARGRDAAEQALRLQPVDSRYHLDMARFEASFCLERFRDVSCRERAVERFHAAAKLAPNNPFPRIAAATLLLDLGDPTRARREAQAALAIEPRSVLPRLVLADAFIDTGEPGRAEEILDEAAAIVAADDGRTLDGYGRDLLRPDPGIVRRLRLKLDAATATAADAP